MCQYYLWRCGVCLTDNEIAQRCGRLPQRCAKKGDLLPLPHDADGITCQWCLQPRCIDQKRTPPACRHVNRCVPPTAIPRNIAEAQWRMPAEADPFWLRPSIRLPDAAEKLAEYDQQRHMVLAAADQAMRLMQHERGATDISRMGQVVALDEAWRKLKEGLQRG